MVSAQIKINREIKKQIIRAFAEDLPRGDITSRYFGDSTELVRANLIAKADGIVSGMPVAEACFLQSNKKIVFRSKIQDGAEVRYGNVLAEIEGPKNSILLGERTALNFLQHMSGVATETNRLVTKIKKTKARLLDTRKTLPGFRKLDKYAVRCGGGQNHRMSLSDMVLIKDNHLADLNFDKLRQKIFVFKRKFPKVKIEIEAETLEQVKRFLTLSVDIILLDNMSPAQLKKAVKLRNQINSKILFEASGNVTEKNIAKISECGVDFISVGAITHSAKALDISLRFK